MRLKLRKRFVLYVAFLSCITLLYSSFTTKTSKKEEDKPTRIIIKSNEKGNLTEIKEYENSQGTRVTTPAANERTDGQVQPMPVPATNEPIIVTPLLYRNIIQFHRSSSYPLITGPFLFFQSL